MSSISLTKRGFTKAQGTRSTAGKTGSKISIPRLTDLTNLKEETLVDFFIAAGYAAAGIGTLAGRKVFRLSTVKQIFAALGLELTATDYKVVNSR